ncbi:MAG: Asp-tRNA(Asn)/Glu-tRNA(Gln) amidotransferase subunit GatC [Rickettsiales bacterium]|nr:Asp-tRNA(Asn)/Glu-tRNA(Gln) amidotransferase subunit GatC [Rickettsiales bacterium]
MITDAVLGRLSRLSRIEIKDNEKEKIKNLLDKDIDDVKNIDSVDTEGLEPLINPIDIILKTNEDIVSDGDKQEELMKCAPQSMYNYFIVPKVVE